MMGNATNLVIIFTIFYLVCGVLTLSIYTINPDSNMLLGNSIFSNDNNELLSITDNNNGIKTYSFNYSNIGFNTLSSNAQLETETFKTPDWIRASNNWFNKGLDNVKTPMKVLVSFVGAPYTLFSNIGLSPELSVLLGISMGVISSLIFANWLFGRDT